MSKQPRDTTAGADDGAPLSEWTATPSPTSGAAPAGDELRLAPGAMLAGRYRIVAPLGRGGMGEIYRAEDTKLGQPVALKFLRSDVANQPLLLERLLAEVRIGREVSHPNVCRLYDIVELGDRHFIAMEYVDGEDLASLLKRIGRLPPDKALELARDLCAGLAAVHDKGIVHRDLKPGNVMIDGRGRARITDFGLAVAVADAERDGLYGTPAYMSPEQLAGGLVTARSDVYALGLLFHEMLTGRRFFEARTIGELRSQHQEPKAAKLASGVRLEPSLERALVQCLEEEPAARPASVRALAALLPGGDPLDAALAAGETPSPELVAAAGRVGALSPLPAWACLGLVLAGLLTYGYLADRTTLLGQAAPPKPPEALAERSRQILTRLGQEGAVSDTAYSLDWDRSFVQHIVQDPTRRDARSLRQDRPGPWYFFHRTSPRKLIALNRDAVVGMSDPPLDVSGMTRVVLDAHGRLVSFVCVPPQVDESSGPWPDPDWLPLIEEAGLDTQALRPVTPRWAAPVDSDRKQAWEGSFGEAGGEFRVEAAAYRGRPVWFELQPSWLRPDRMQPGSEPVTRIPVGEASVVLLALAMPLGGLLLARRNIKLGRGDRPGALRVALFVFSAYSLARLFRADHVSDFGQEVWLLVKLLAYPSFWAALVWLLYIALEPYARRRWPHMLISWQRLFSGRLRDPLVGRDLLLGCATGVLLATLHQLMLLPGWIDGPPPAPDTNISGATLSELRQVMFRLFVNPYSAVLYSLAFLFMLVVLRVLLRIHMLAALAWCIVVAGPVSGQSPELAWLAGGLRAVVLLVTLSRGGLLRLAATLFCLFTMLEAPLTLDLSRWYAPCSLPQVLAVAGLALYGFHTALGGKPAFGRLLEE